MVKATSLDMSLADIIKTKKTKKVVRKAGGIKKRAAGPAGSANGTPRRQSGGIRKTIRKPAPISPAARNEKKRTVRINVSNLAPSVASSDLRDLFGEFRLRNASVNFNESGNHLGTGDILLSKLDADRLIQKYAGVALDGKVMQFAVIENANFLNRAAAAVRPAGKPTRKLVKKKPVGGAKAAGKPAAVAKKTKKPKREPKQQKTAEELDAELDAYMSRN